MIGARYIMEVLAMNLLSSVLCSKHTRENATNNIYKQGFFLKEKVLSFAVPNQFLLFQGDLGCRDQLTI